MNETQIQAETKNNPFETLFIAEGPKKTAREFESFSLRDRECGDSPFFVRSLPLTAAQVDKKKEDLLSFSPARDSFFFPSLSMGSIVMEEYELLGDSKYRR